MQLKKLHEIIEANSMILKISTALKFCSAVFKNKKSLVAFGKRSLFLDSA